MTEPLAARLLAGLVSVERGIGEAAFVDALPAAVTVVFAAVTHLADPWFLFALLAFGYWFGDDRLAASPRRAGATAVAAVGCAYAVTALGKAWFAVPRPPGAAGPATVPGWLPGLLSGWYETQVRADGFGFPSGHATGAAAAYGALAVLYDRLWTRRRRATVAVAVAAAVAASRVVIGVHYVVDIAAGLVAGAVTVAGALWLAGDPRLRDGLAVGASSGSDGADGDSATLDPVPPFVFAASVSLLAAGVALGAGHVDAVVEAVIGVAAGVGGAVGWRLVAGDEPPLPVRTGVLALFVGGAVGGLLVYGSALVGSPPVTLVATALAVAGVVALPALSVRLDRRRDGAS